MNQMTLVYKYDIILLLQYFFAHMVPQSDYNVEWISLWSVMVMIQYLNFEYLSHIRYIEPHVDAIDINLQQQTPLLPISCRFIVSLPNNMPILQYVRQSLGTHDPQVLLSPLLVTLSHFLTTNGGLLQE